MRVEISDIVDPMETANSLVNISKMFSDDQMISEIMKASKDMSKELIESLASEPEAFRGAAVVLKMILEMVQEMVTAADQLDCDDDLELVYIERELFSRAVCLGFPAVILSFFSCPELLEAKNKIEGTQNIEGVFDDE